MHLTLFFCYWKSSWRLRSENAASLLTRMRSFLSWKYMGVFCGTEMNETRWIKLCLWSFKNWIRLLTWKVFALNLWMNLIMSMNPAQFGLEKFQARKTFKNFNRKVFFSIKKLLKNFISLFEELNFQLNPYLNW